MAARLNPKQDERTRSCIQTTKLVHRLQGFALCEVDPQSGKPVAMSRDQITATIALLKKTLPDLVSTTLAGEDGGAVKLEMIRRVIVDHRNSDT